MGGDRHQLVKMAEQARAEMAVETLNVVADRGYYEGEELCACECQPASTRRASPLHERSIGRLSFRLASWAVLTVRNGLNCPI